MTLPLSYSRLRGSPTSLTRRYGGQARRSSDFADLLLRRLNFRVLSLTRLYPKMACRPKLAERAKVGGEGRIRTFEAAWATDLQSAAFDRFATSPIPGFHVSAAHARLTAEKPSLL